MQKASSIQGLISLETSQILLDQL
ncbi:hypothetical protein Goarm_023361 [Gossypium armourianum]|uniref:Uncharacterized protein n=1 Tax=Gossypium armourianum TaxID=34283 RepID=A0A7J9KFC0_9ROSI|nr:hypothetical protein [Gossypium armourianum]